MYLVPGHCCWKSILLCKVRGSENTYLPHCCQVFSIYEPPGSYYWMKESFHLQCSHDFATFCILELINGCASPEFKNFIKTSTTKLLDSLYIQVNATWEYIYGFLKKIKEKTYIKDTGDIGVNYVVPRQISHDRCSEKLKWIYFSNFCCF